MEKARIIRRLLGYFAPKSFNDGLSKCNDFGKSLIKCTEVDKFLDVGCGNGKLTLEFTEVVKAKNIYGVEFVDEFRQEAEKKGIKCIKQNLNHKWDFDDDSFDLILSSQNIEHMHNTRLYLEECYRCLKRGGQLIILTENLASWINIGALLFGWQPFSMTNIDGWSLGSPVIWHSDIKDEALSIIDKYYPTGVSGTVGHVRVLTPCGLKDLLEKVGFQDVKIATRGYLPLWGRISELLCKVDVRHGHFLIGTGFKLPRD